MSGIPEWGRQQGWGVRLDWGRAGAAAVGPGSAVLVVVDVLSFTTAVSVLADAGTTVLPYRWRDETAAAHAAAHGAALAVGRREVSAARPWSLSPAALRAAPFTERLVLPSPNGSAIAASVTGTPVVAASLRNAGAVADWILAQGWGTAARPVSIVAAGEQWPGTDTLRPAVEDWLGAGAVAAALAAGGAGPPSPEALVAAAAHTPDADLAALVTDSASGRELAGNGFAADVAVAVELGASAAVPVLTPAGFVDHGTGARR
ncbi:2-phosphosulfolactate phosphatase [Nocardia thailandica]|uniref:Probable 2-phosphosulfolactate phosphatase n=1 Tax=Nocardia thailandica TaxID=257275 RepID=A0ABW6PNL6_9NOCA